MEEGSDHGNGEEEKVKGNITEVKFTRTVAVCCIWGVGNA